MTHIVDGYNLLRRGFPERTGQESLEEARAFLVAALGAFVASSPGSTVVLVFDGRGRASRHRREGGRLEILYSGAGKSADDVIVELCRRSGAPRDTVAVTSDLEDIARRVRAFGCRHESSENFARRLEQAVGETGGLASEEKPSGRVSDEDTDSWLREFGMHPDDDEPW